MELLQFKDVAMSMGMNEGAARISLALPPIDDHVLQYRSFCIADMLTKRLIESGHAEKITQNQWGEVKRCYTASKERVICLIQFNSSPEPFPLVLPVKAIVGHKDAIIQGLRKVERDLPVKLQAWCDITKNGLVRFRSNQEMLRIMDKYHKVAS